MSRSSYYYFTPANVFCCACELWEQHDTHLCFCAFFLLLYVWCVNFDADLFHFLLLSCLWFVCIFLIPNGVGLKWHFGFLFFCCIFMQSHMVVDLVSLHRHFAFSIKPIFPPAPFNRFSSSWSFPIVQSKN